jgi:hypothetical protein
VLLATVATSLALAASEHENVNPNGILVLNDVLVLFATVQKVPSCSVQSQPAAAQIYVSTNAGKTWTKRGPELEGSQFEYAYESGGKLWVAGEHTAEGPSIDPFVLVPGEAPSEWVLHTIYKGPSELEGVAFQENGELVAWVRHVNINADNLPGTTYIHKSSDGGRTWKTVGQVKGLSNQPGRRFRKIEKQSATWQVVDQGDRGFIVQQRQGEQTAWKTVSQFPLYSCQQ